MPTPWMPWIRPFHVEVVTRRFRRAESFLLDSCCLQQVQTISLPTWGMQYIVVEPSPSYRGSAADYPYRSFFEPSHLCFRTTLWHERLAGLPRNSLHFHLRIATQRPQVEARNGTWSRFRTYLRHRYLLPLGVGYVISA